MVTVSSLDGLRGVVVLPFVLLVPGWSWVRLAGLRSPVVEVAASVLVSCALLTLATGAALLAGRWSPTFGFAVVTGLSFIALVVGMRKP